MVLDNSGTSESMASNFFSRLLEAGGACAISAHDSDVTNLQKQLSLQRNSQSMKLLHKVSHLSKLQQP